jgi:hypothetical protein
LGKLHWVFARPIYRREITASRRFCVRVVLSDCVSNTANVDCEAVNGDAQRCSAAIDVTVEHVDSIAKELPKIADVAHRFLVDWRGRFLELDRHAPIETVPSDT